MVRALYIDGKAYIFADDICAALGCDLEHCTEPPRYFSGDTRVLGSADTQRLVSRLENNRARAFKEWFLTGPATQLLRLAGAEMKKMEEEMKNGEVSPPHNGSTSGNLTPFAFEGHKVRVIDREDQPWWVLADVCDVLDIRNSRDAADRLDDDEKDGVVITDALGRQQTATGVNESGLWSLVLTSRKPEAKRFKKWLTSEVLPALRKTGSYSLKEGTPSIASEPKPSWTDVDPALLSKTFKAYHALTKGMGLPRNYALALASDWLEQKFGLNPARVARNLFRPAKPGIAEHATLPAFPKGGFMAWPWVLEEQTPSGWVKTAGSDYALSPQASMDARLLNFALAEIQGVGKSPYMSVHRVSDTVTVFEPRHREKLAREEHDPEPRLVAMAVDMLTDTLRDETGQGPNWRLTIGF